MVAAPTPVEIFCSYAHEDEPWLRKLETHLSLLKRQGLISFWHDRLISPSVNWAQAIDACLETASVILLLVSADFFASDYCYGIEMKRALERHEAGEARIIPVLVRPVDFNRAPFAHLQPLPTDTRPLAVWENQDLALVDVAAGLRRVIEDLSLVSVSSPTASSERSIDDYIKKLEVLKKLEDKKLLRSEVIIRFQESIVAKILDVTIPEVPIGGERSKPTNSFTEDLPSLRKKIFICYCHKDKKWWEKINTALQPLLHKEMLSLWIDTQIKPGDKWQEEVGEALNTAKVAVLLVSQNFLASDFIIQHELPALLNAARQRGLVVLWLAISDSLYTETDIVLYQALSDPSRPFDSLSRATLNRELVKICKEIKRFAS